MADIVSKPLDDKGREEYERIFGKKEKSVPNATPRCRHDITTLKSVLDYNRYEAVLTCDLCGEKL